jgi:iron complex outermembrane receptor protein
MKNLLLLLIITPFSALSQIAGTVVDKKSKAPIYGAKVVASTGEKALSDFDGKFTITPKSYPVDLYISATTYLSDTIRVTGPGPLKVQMRTEVQEVKSVVVAAGRRDQEIEEVPISMEIIRPELFDNKGLANLEEVVDQSPGVFTMDGQVSIRGGSGFAYGAGSRVLLLWNGIPILSGDAGDAKWNAIPLECASQIEILKGASSVLYGSGALNGIISLNEREPGLDGETRVKIQGGIYDSPRRSELKWWDGSQTFYQGEAYYGKMYKNVGFTISANGFTSEGYKEGEWEDRGRISGTFYIRPEKVKNLKAGIGYNFQMQENGNFIIWESDSMALQPQGGADPYDTLSGSTLTFQKAYRFSVDPYVKFYDKAKNLHTFKSRYYYIQNDNLTNLDYTTASGVLYGDYQFQHEWDRGMVVTTGLTGIRTDVFSALFGDHFSNNFAAYGQFEYKLWDKLDLTGGLRLEYFDQDDQRGDTDFYLNADSTSKLPVYPIARFGAHYKVGKATHFRASFGQGIRYPSVAERYTSTSVGALNIFANPALIPETGWAVELGVKQAVMIGDNWKGMIDVAGFINQYDNMMEFQFGIFNPENSNRLDLATPEGLAEYLLLTAPVASGGGGYTIDKMLGFSAINAEKARISGVEFSFNSIGQIGEFTVTSLLGYTYMVPVTLNDNPDYLQTYSTFEDTTIIEGTDTTYSYSFDKTLKYRFNHLVKADIEIGYKNYSVGFSTRYNSNMTNIDVIFLQDIAGVYILPGLEAYRERFDKGSLVFDARIGYKIKEKYRLGFMVNNVFNTEYTSRPGDVMPPRNFILQLQMKF